MIRAYVVCTFRRQLGTRDLFQSFWAWIGCCQPQRQFYRAYCGHSPALLPIHLFFCPFATQLIADCIQVWEFRKNWRQAVELEEGNLDGDSVLKKLFKIYGKEFKQDPGKGGNSWYADQQLVSVFVNRHASANNMTLDLRAHTGGRLDRSHGESHWIKC